MLDTFAARVKCGLLLGGACIASATAGAQQQSLSEVYRSAYEALWHGRYLDAVEMLRPLAVDEHGRARDLKAFNLWNQLYVDISSEPYRSVNEIAVADDRTLTEQLRGARAHPAISIIVDRARDTRIVILNEDHVHPSHRAFALEVATALRPLGYKILALEALNNRGDSASRIGELQRRGYVVWDDGFYLHEPVFADFVRQALHLGYAPASYEDVAAHSGTQDQRFEAREQGEAENLATIIRAHPADKFLIYVGQSHLAEHPLGDNAGKQMWMAARLAALTGIDPLTIDQSTLDQDCVACRRLSREMNEPVVFFRGQRTVITGQYKGVVDLQVFAPATKRIEGRPGWLPGMGRKPVQVPPDLLPAHGERLVQAFLRTDSADAVPVDQFVVTAGQPAPAFMLPAGKIRFSYEQPETKRQSGSGR